MAAKMAEEEAFHVPGNSRGWAGSTDTTMADGIIGACSVEENLYTKTAGSTRMPLSHAYQIRGPLRSPSFNETKDVCRNQSIVLEDTHKSPCYQCVDNLEYWVEHGKWAYTIGILEQWDYVTAFQQGGAFSRQEEITNGQYVT